MLNFASGEPFSTGMVECELREVNSGREDNIRIFLSIQVEGVQTRAVLDTGGVYCILDPTIATVIGFDPDGAIRSTNVSIRGQSYSGNLYRANLEIIAQIGNTLRQEVTVFVPDAEIEDWRGRGLPTFLGLTGCLEFIRFALDPLSESFYFGPTEMEIN